MHLRFFSTPPTAWFSSTFIWKVRWRKGSVLTPRFQTINSSYNCKIPCVFFRQASVVYVSIPRTLESIFYSFHIILLKSISEKKTLRIDNLNQHSKISSIKSWFIHTSVIFGNLPKIYDSLFDPWIYTLLILKTVTSNVFLENFQTGNHKFLLMPLWFSAELKISGENKVVFKFYCNEIANGLHVFIR